MPPPPVTWPMSFIRCQSTGTGPGKPPLWPLQSCKLDERLARFLYTCSQQRNGGGGAVGQAYEGTAWPRNC